MNAKLNKSLVGKRFTCSIEGDFVEGKLQEEVNEYYLCQNLKDGQRCINKLGYNYSWAIGKEEILPENKYQIINLTFKQLDPETYKDWQVGDKIIMYNESIKGKIIFRSGKVVIYEHNKKSSYPYTCDELFERGYRLDVPIIPEEPKILELTLDDIALKYGMAVSQIKIKK